MGEFLLADSKFLIKDVERRYGVKIDIDVAKCTVVIRSKSKSAKESASTNISSLIEKFKAELSSQEIAETEVDNDTVDSQEEAQAILQKNETKSQEEAQAIFQKNETKEQLMHNANNDRRENIPTILKDITRKDETN